MNVEIMERIVDHDVSAEDSFVNPKVSDSARTLNRLEVNALEQTYQANQTIRLDLPTSGIMRCHNLYLSYELTITGGTDTQNNQAVIDGSVCMMDRFTLYAGGQIVDQYSDYAKIHTLVKRNGGSLNNAVLADANVSTLQALVDADDFGALTNAGGAWTNDDIAEGSRRLIVPLFTGLLNSGKTLVLGSLPKLQLEITLKPNADVIRGNAACVYTLRNVKFHMNEVEKVAPEFVRAVTSRLVSADMDESMAIPIVYTSHQVSKQTLDAVSGDKIFNFNQAYSNVKALYAGHFRTGAFADNCNTSTRGGAQNSDQNGMTRWQFLIENSYYPAQVAELNARNLSGVLPLARQLYHIDIDDYQRSTSLSNATYLSNDAQDTPNASAHFVVGQRLNSSRQNISGRSILNNIQLQTSYATPVASTLALVTEFSQLVLLSRNHIRTIF